MHHTALRSLLISPLRNEGHISPDAITQGHTLPPSQLASVTNQCRGRKKNPSLHSRTNLKSHSCFGFSWGLDKDFVEAAWKLHFSPAQSCFLPFLLQLLMQKHNLTNFPHANLAPQGQILGNPTCHRPYCHDKGDGKLTSRCSPLLSCHRPLQPGF